MSEYDLLIKGGTIVDGSGDEPFKGDIAVKDGLIVGLGAKLSGTAHRTIDADGRLVTPGFVDLDTHYDGQVTWEDADAGARPGRLARRANMSA